MASGEIDPQPHKYWPSVESLKASGQKTFRRHYLFVDFTKAFDSIHRGKMELILLAYGLPKKTVTAIMILYRNTKVKVRSPDGDTEYFDIVAGVLQSRHASPIPLYYLSRLRALELRSTKSEKMASSWLRKEAKGTPQKQSQTRLRLRWWLGVTGEYA